MYLFFQAASIASTKESGTPLAPSFQELKEKYDDAPLEDDQAEDAKANIAINNTFPNTLRVLYGFCELIEYG